MNPSPSYKIIAPFAAIYALCLFIPTIDALATTSYKLFSFTISFNVATLIFPAIYPLSDSITEVYGKKISYYISFLCYVVIIFFSIVNNFLLSQVDNKQIYNLIVKSSIIVTVAGPISYIITSYININCIYKLKMKMRNTHFIFRSFLSSAISGFIMSMIVQGALYYNDGFEIFLKMFLTIFMIKIIITLPYIYLAKMLVILYRYIDGLEFEKYNKNLVSYIQTAHQ